MKFIAYVAPLGKKKLFLYVMPQIQPKSFTGLEPDSIAT